MNLKDLNPKKYYCMNDLSKFRLDDGRRLDDALRHHPLAPTFVEGARLPKGHRSTGKYFTGRQVENFAEDYNKSAFRNTPVRVAKIAKDINALESEREFLLKEVDRAEQELWRIKRNAEMQENYALNMMREFFDRYMNGVDGVLCSMPVSGVYFLRHMGKVVYVGQSVNILGRVSQHQGEKEFDSVSYVRCQKENLNNVEGFFIKLLAPELNRDRNGRLQSPSSSVECFDDLTHLLLPVHK